MLLESGCWDMRHLRYAACNASWQMAIIVISFSSVASSP
ncbi:hypothetical protein KCO_06150 [Pectobacterium brasiliense ICMP 19477]|nr:hypothetical protein KCO_06150 [Pectobacterium brasiliense ICMP 19477]